MAFSGAGNGRFPAFSGAGILQSGAGIIWTYLKCILTPETDYFWRFPVPENSNQGHKTFLSFLNLNNSLISVKKVRPGKTPEGYIAQT